MGIESQTIHATTQPTTATKKPVRSAGAEDHGKEVSNLIYFSQKLQTQANAMQDSLNEYSTKVHVSPDLFPKNVDALNTVLSRFFETKSIKDVYDLVGNHQDKLQDALAFTKAPASGSANRAKLREAADSLQKIIDNLPRYKSFNTETTEVIKADGAQVKLTNTKDGKTGTVPHYQYEITNKRENNDGFKNYGDKVKIITDFTTAYDDLMTYVQAVPLNALNLPKTAEELRQKVLALPQPSKEPVGAGGNNKQSQCSEDFAIGDEDSGCDKPTSGDATGSKASKEGFFQLGSDTDIQNLNTMLYNQATQDITLRKHVCHESSLKKLAAYNQCVVQRKANTDETCKPIKIEYENARDNCASHYPMTTETDTIVESTYNTVEVIMTNQDYSEIDNSQSLLAITGYVEAANIISSQPLLQIAGVDYTKGGVEQAGKLGDLEHILNYNDNLIDSSPHTDTSNTAH